MQFLGVTLILEVWRPLAKETAGIGALCILQFVEGISLGYWERIRKESHLI